MEVDVIDLALPAGAGGSLVGLLDVDAAHVAPSQRIDSEYEYLATKTDVAGWVYLPRRVAPHAGHVGASVILPPGELAVGTAHLAPLLDGLLDLPLGAPELLAVFVDRVLHEKMEPELVLARLAECKG